MFILMLLGETLNSLLFVSGSLFIVAVMKNILILKGCRHLIEKGAVIHSDSVLHLQIFVKSFFVTATMKEQV
jgi:hypothetical protein